MSYFNINFNMIFTISLLASQAIGKGGLKASGSLANSSKTTSMIKHSPLEEMIRHNRIPLNEKVGYCYPTHLCTRAGGHCFTNYTECKGTVDPYGCRGSKKCKCCIPEVPACGGLFAPVGDSCFLLALTHTLTWAAARQYCLQLGADLVVFKDANHYAETLDYIRIVNDKNAAINVWIGGSDEAVEGHWVWVTEELMPRGPPFWGSTDSYRAEPGGGRRENCAALNHADRYYIHDYSCSITTHAPLCQKIPA